MAQRHIIVDRAPLEQFLITLGGSSLLTRVSSSNGVVSFDSVSSGNFAVTKKTSYSVLDISSKHSQMVSPTPGETFIAPAELRLIASGYDATRFGGPLGSDHAATKVEFYLNDTLVATVNDSVNFEYNVFKTRVTGIAAGTYSVWSRAYVSGGLTLDSKPFTITVSAAPTYGSTVNLVSNVDWSGQVINYVGTSGARIRINGNGFKWTGTPTSITTNFVDFFNMGASSGNSSTYGIDLTTSGATQINNCRFDGCTPIRVNNSAGAVTVTNNLSRSNSRNPLGQTTDFSGGEAHGSFPCLEFTGASGSAKVFETNNIGAGWASFASPSWTVGGATNAKANICQGPRVGLFGTSSFSGTVKLNYSYHIYYGGWSQGNNFDYFGTAPTIEHNVVLGSSWPLRGINGTCRYNLVLGEFISPGVSCEGLIWPFDSAPDVHHNVLRCEKPGRGLIYSVYSPTNSRIRNNTLDSVSNSIGSPLMELLSGTHTVNSNLCVNGATPAIDVTGAASVTADYNAFNNLAGVRYSDGRTPVHDIGGNPAFVAAPTEFIPFDIKAVWLRTKTVTSLLADYRGYYTPTATVIDVGDTGTYGAGNDIGAIGAGTANANDLFGTL